MQVRNVLIKIKDKYKLIVFRNRVLQQIVGAKTRQNFMILEKVARFKPSCELSNITNVMKCKGLLRAGYAAGKCV